jgi:cation:H+ antiporter
MDLLQIVTLVVSLAGLAFTSRYVIKYVEDLIELTRFGETSIGFALLSVVTSTPELAVAFFAVVDGTPELSIGDLLGSNVFNIGIVVGVLMLTAGFLKECPEGLDELADILLLSSIIPLILVIFKASNPILGFGLLMVFGISVYRQTRVRTLAPLPDNSHIPRRQVPLTILKILAGTSVVMIAARFTVSSAVEIALDVGFPPLVVGAVIIAFGTSLPELSLTIVAVKKGRTRLASANAIGSNLTNLTLILGLVFASSLFKPFTIDLTSFLETISFVLITSLIVWHHMTRGGDCRTIGIILILTYVVFQLTTLLL